MLRNYYINRAFIVSATARKIYRVAAVFPPLMFVMVIVLKMGGVSAGAFPIVRLFLFVGAMGTGVTMVAMEYFLFGFDRSSSFKKAFWCCMMVLLPTFGPSLYCFLVYSRLTVANAVRPDQAESAPA